jgi:hypothetical protein
MYNIFKRPMFKLGGMTQGTGIMSHVESRPQYFSGGRIMAQGGYDPRGSYFGYGADPRGTYFGPSQKTPISQTPPGMFDPYNVSPTATTTEAEKISAFEKGQAARKAALNNALKYGKYGVGAASTLSQYGAGILGPVAPVLAGFGLGYGRGKLIDYRNQLLQDLEKTRTNQTSDGIDDLGQVGIRPDYYEGAEPEKIVKKEIPTPKPDAAKSPAYKETNPREEIQKEANLIREAIGEDFGGGEAALIISRALATPGTIADKIRAATELAIPLVKEKRKGQRDVVLKAYEAYKDKEKTQIAAGKKGEVGQLIDQYVAGKIKAGDKRDPELIANEFIEERYLGAGKEEGALQKVIFSEDYKTTIKPAIDKLNKYERQKQLTGQISKEEQKMLDDAKFTVDQYIKKYPQFKQYITTENLATGGRVGLAEGTQPESVIEETVMKEGPSDVAIKPVNKLSYAELRDRLPKEITNDIVQLIANSEEALQEFAYIRTQRDINDFNVKYGVNLVLPATR